MPLHTFTRPRGRIVELTIDSAALRGNLLSDPTTRTVAVYLPEGYDDDLSTRYPLLVDLASFTGSGLKRLAWTAFGEAVPQRLDRLRAEGRMGPVVVAFPDAFTSLGGNQYVDSVAMGHWERFLIEDLLPRLEHDFRLLPGPAHRAVYGKSSGGYGALVQGMRHAEQWAAVACHSGDMGFDLLYLREFPAVLDTLARHGGIAAFLERVRAVPTLAGHDFHTLMILAMGASYDPDPEAPAGARLPVDPHTCALLPERWQAWLRHDPVILVEDPPVQRSLASLRGLYLDCGRRDQYFLHYGARRLSQALQHHGIDHTYEEFDGTHSGTEHRLDVSLPFLHRAMLS
ncbi:alpha/beta hydrolase [Paraliomyxa miuraensis]|uniref:alpha/beta hydrolase n=1 Tax=Paraliomyxa miuraensis TaxID=376150 RepID=UPI00225B7D6C|nr:alpha/beta hydrolase-fold protein [Paraliomyxa miuraensis]MCX4245368.1 alpha/beta hydrolase-fold protein [Paraliomyxa miuraensis]